MGIGSNYAEERGTQRVEQRVTYDAVKYKPCPEAQLRCFLLFLLSVSNQIQNLSPFGVGVVKLPFVDVRSLKDKHRAQNGPSNSPTKSSPDRLKHSTSHKSFVGLDTPSVSDFQMLTALRLLSPVGFNGYLSQSPECSSIHTHTQSTQWVAPTHSIPLSGCPWVPANSSVTRI